MSELKTIQPLVITEQQLESAFQWLIQQRKNYPANADIWFFRRDWDINKDKLLETLCSGDYVFSALKRIEKQDNSVIHLWSSQDALVLKLLSQILSENLELSIACTHVKGHGGLKQAVADAQKNLKDYQFVCKTDVLHYYETIDQYLLMEQIHQQIDNNQWGQINGVKINGVKINGVKINGVKNQWGQTRLKFVQNQWGQTRLKFVRGNYSE